MNAGNKLTSILVAISVTLFPTKFTDIFIFSQSFKVESY